VTSATLLLRHVTSGETREVPILRAEVGQKMLIRWGMAGLYTYSGIQRGLLNGRRVMPWRAADEDAYLKLWQSLYFPGKTLPTAPGDPCDPNTPR
jgi:hypothetical protein